MSNLFSLEGKVVLVTGAARGIGWAIAEAMAKEDAQVVLNDLDAKEVEERAAELAGAGHQAAAAPFDVTDHEAIKAEIQRIVRDYGGIDVLVNNAGIDKRIPFLEFSDRDYQDVIDVNLTACFVLAREAACVMVSRGSGRIINIASNVVAVSRSQGAAYVASKGGIAALTRTLAVELGPQGITCNAIGPGFTVTDAMAASKLDTGFADYISRRTPLGRWAKPEDIGGAAVFLASDAASFVNGQLLMIDGGMSVAV